MMPHQYLPSHSRKGAKESAQLLKPGGASAVAVVHQEVENQWEWNGMNYGDLCLTNSYIQ